MQKINCKVPKKGNCARKSRRKTAGRRPENGTRLDFHGRQECEDVAFSDACDESWLRGAEAQTLPRTTTPMIGAEGDWIDINLVAAGENHFQLVRVKN